MSEDVVHTVCCYSTESMLLSKTISTSLMLCFMLDLWSLLSLLLSHLSLITDSLLLLTLDIILTVTEGRNLKVVTMVVQIVWCLKYID